MDRGTGEAGRLPTVLSGRSLEADHVDLETPFALPAAQQRRGGLDDSGSSPASGRRSNSGEHRRVSQASDEQDRGGVLLSRTHSGVQKFLRPLQKSKMDEKIAHKKLERARTLLERCPSRLGEEPGLDLARRQYTTVAGRFNKPAVIQAMQYDTNSVEAHNYMTIRDLVNLLGNTDQGVNQVRWINIEGLNWDAIEALAVHYNLHPLAVEDALHTPQRIKADFYDGCMYMCVLAMELKDDTAGDADPFGSRPGSQDGKSGASKPDKDPWGQYLGGQVSVQQCSLFLLNKGKTLITLFQTDSSFVTQPLRQQINKSGTQLRESEDGSFLMYRVLDSIVDHLQPIVDEYDLILDMFEETIQEAKPSAKETLLVYALQRELIQMHRKMSPLTALASNLTSRDSQNDGMISKLSQVYMRDIIDHMESASENLLGLSDECRDLISLTFNLTAHRQALSSQTLTIVSVIFLPISFLAGVYGTNFTVVPELQWQYGYAYFWALCITVTSIFIVTLHNAGFFKSE